MKIFNGTEVIDVEVKPSHLSPLLVDSDNHHYHPNNFITADNVDIYFKTPAIVTGKQIGRAHV